MNWKSTSETQREEMYRKYKLGEDLSPDAKLLGMRVESLTRQLRRWAAQRKHLGNTPVLVNTTTAENVEQKEQVTVDAGANTITMESNSRRITTLEQLIEYCKIDLNEWVIDRHIINKWDVGIKTKEDVVVTKPLFQIKVWLTKRNPAAVKPVIQPVRFTVSQPRKPQIDRSLRAALIVPDTQFGFSREVHRGTLLPFHDRRALDIVRQIAQVIEPDITIFLGDLNDYSGWSDKYIRRPEFYFTTQPALIEASWYVAQLRALTTGDVFVLEGNHDIRPENQIIHHLVDAYQLRSADRLDASPVMSIDNLLGLSRMGVNYVSGYPDGEVWINENTRCIHGSKVRGAPGQTAAAVVRDANETTIFGHIHRTEFATRTIRTRCGTQYITAYSPGCLCHVDGRVPGSNREAQWQQGAAVVWFDEKVSHITPIYINDGVGYYNGDVYVGYDYVEELRADTEWDF